MIGVRVVAIASLGCVLGGLPLAAQTPLRYRDYALESSVASVVKISGARDYETRTLHERPARIQEVVWRAPYAPPGNGLTDPVRDVRFSFYDDKLYQIVVTYDRDRTEGLTADDVIESLSGTYGIPLLSSRGTVRVTPPTAGAPANDATTVAQWETATALLTLMQGTYPPEYQLVLISKTLNERASTAIEQSVRLDAQEAPQREMDRREKKVTDARIASQKARVINKAAFRP
jgi:hypothetical protein